MTQEERKKLAELAQDVCVIQELLDSREDPENIDLGLTALANELAHWANTGKFLTHPE